MTNSKWIWRFKLDGSQAFQIDNGHVVCWQDTLNYSLEILFGFRTGEGLLNTFKRKGESNYSNEKYSIIC